MSVPQCKIQMKPEREQIGRASAKQKPQLEGFDESNEGAETRRELGEKIQVVGNGRCDDCGGVGNTAMQQLRPTRKVVARQD